MKPQFWIMLVLVFSACTAPQDLEIPLSRPIPLKSGSDFLTPDSRDLQNDDFSNPAMLWAERGNQMFQATSKTGKACAECHNESSLPLNLSAAHFPKLDPKSGQLTNLEGQINLCRTRYQDEKPLAYESDDLLSLTAYVARLSKGVSLNPPTGVKVKDAFKRGQTYFNSRRGQMNFSCAQCHDETWGKKLRGDTISQGHGNGFPAYRFEWQALGSLHRRLADCDRGVRAEPLPLGSQTYIDLELYLARRAIGLTVESPAIRR